MRRKARDILRDQQGLSMILVLCIGALFVALSAALVYAASVLTANANRQLLEQEAYQLATSFSDVLEGELNTPTSSFAAFVNDSFMTSTAYGGDIYGSPSQPYSYTWKAADADTSGAEEITVTLPRRSLFMLLGDSRYVYRHGIPLVTQRRWSMSFRTLTAEGEALRASFET